MPGLVIMPGREGAHTRICVQHILALRRIFSLADFNSCTRAELVRLRPAFKVLIRMSKGRLTARGALLIDGLHQGLTPMMPCKARDNEVQ
jgi:hypothetical protein